MKLSADEVCKDLDCDLRERIFSPYINLSLYNADLGCGLPGEMFIRLLEEFNKLDELSPYDNGLTYISLFILVSCINDIAFFSVFLGGLVLDGEALEHGAIRQSVLEIALLCTLCTLFAPD